MHLRRIRTDGRQSGAGNWCIFGAVIYRISAGRLPGIVYGGAYNGAVMVGLTRLRAAAVSRLTTVVRRPCQRDRLFCDCSTMAGLGASATETLPDRGGRCSSDVWRHWLFRFSRDNGKKGKNKNMCGRDGRTICGPQCVPKSTCVSLLGGATWRSVMITGRTDRRNALCGPLLGRRAA